MSAFQYTKIDLYSQSVCQYQLFQAGGILSFGEMLDLWQASKAFRSFFHGILESSPFDAYFWETPPLTQNKLDQGAEFVLVRADSLSSVQAESKVFSAHYNDDWVVSFGNLGGDAHLVVPCPKENRAYPHLGAFMREAPEDQKHALWSKVGEEYSKLISHQPKWLSTAGLGVYWLHIRMDSRPKYYRFRAYKGNG